MTTLQNASGTTLTMSSQEIATLTGKDKTNIHRDIKEQIIKSLYGKADSNLNDLQIQGLTIEYDARGYWKNVHMDRYHTDILISGYEVKYRAAIIKRMMELEAKQKPLTRLEQLKLEVEREEQRLVMIEEIKEKTKVIEHKQVLTDDSTEYASIKRMKLFNPNLRCSGMLLKRVSENAGYAVPEVYSHYASGTVKTYHRDIWELLYPESDFPDSQ